MDENLKKTCIEANQIRLFSLLLVNLKLTHLQILCLKKKQNIFLFLWYVTLLFTFSFVQLSIKNVVSKWKVKNDGFKKNVDC